MTSNLKNLSKLAYPVVLGQIANMILHFVDRYFIAMLGVDEAAGSSLSGGLIWVLMSFTMLISGGTVAYISRRVGEKDFVKAGIGAEQSVLLSVFLGIFLGLVSFIFSEQLIGFYNATPTVTEIGIVYFDVLAIGFPFLISGMVLASVFQAAGDTKTPMFIFAGMSVMNLILDPAFIFGFHLIPPMGVKGAAIASVLSEACAFIAILYMMIKSTKFKIQFKNFFIIHREIAFRILRIGFWTGLNGFSRPLSAIFLQKALAYHGTKAIAAFSFGIQWISLYFVVMEGVRVAVATLVGQNLGDKNYPEVHNSVKSGLKLGVLIVILSLIVGIPLKETAISIFSKDPEIIKMGSSYLFIVIISLIFEVPMTVYAAALNGAGDTKPPMIIAFISNWLGKISIAYIFTYIFNFGVDCVWWAISASIVIEGVGMWIWFKRGTWMRRVV
ncbi:MAG: MATE family efflux transporter [Candidatus Delongbacteria bacterium]|nr:MATE family efflux transporter [Candidatus Delongbacteria bacterium]MBN2835829.1 MATE family efflux transporter [Candidatus Delongbacteria bacterium]